jgi:hypothetical protein
VTREQMLISELTAYEADVIALQVHTFLPMPFLRRDQGWLTNYVPFDCLPNSQEVDQLPALRPHLTEYTATEGRGRNKRHGLVVLHRSALFTAAASEVVYLDEAEVREGGGEDEARWRRAGTRETKNVGLLVALRNKSGDGGVVRLTIGLPASIWALTPWKRPILADRRDDASVLAPALSGRAHAPGRRPVARDASLPPARRLGGLADRHGRRYVT